MVLNALSGGGWGWCAGALDEGAGGSGQGEREGCEDGCELHFCLVVDGLSGRATVVGFGIWSFVLRWELLEDGELRRRRKTGTLDSLYRLLEADPVVIARQT